MDGVNAIKLLLALTFVHGTNGQTATVTGSSPVAAGTGATLTCDITGGTPPAIAWVDDSKDPPETLFAGTFPLTADEKFSNFEVTTLTTSQSVMTISSAEVTDDGVYRCDIAGTDDSMDFVVEAPGTLTGPTVRSFVNSSGEDMYEATCEVVGSKPPVNITWYLNGTEQTNGNGKTIDETYPPTPSNPPLSNTKSVFTFPATQENHLQTLECRSTGYQLTELERQKSRDLDIHTSPSTARTTVTADYITDGTDIRVTCTPQNEPAPSMRNYYIFSNGTLIHESMDNVTDVTVSNPVVGTDYTCMAGNYLGNTSLSAAVTYDPTRTTTPPTAPSTTEPVVGGRSPDPGTGLPTDGSPLTTTITTGTTKAPGLKPAAIAGIAVGAIIFIALIIVVIVVFVVKPDCIGGSGSPNTTTTHKHSTSAVGSSNGNEKNDVEAPLNGVNEVITQEKIRPEAAPRGHSSIKHTTDNPQQAEYAMVDRRPGGRGDSTDARGNGAGQNEQPGMHYADLDLTSSAGHSDRVVPKNEDGVVVYSSILV